MKGISTFLQAKWVSAFAPLKKVPRELVTDYLLLSSHTKTKAFPPIIIITLLLLFKPRSFQSEYGPIVPKFVKINQIYAVSSAALPRGSSVYNSFSLFQNPPEEKKKKKKKFAPHQSEKYVHTNKT